LKQQILSSKKKMVAERERDYLLQLASCKMQLASKGLATTIKNKITHFSFFVPDGIISLYINPNS